MENSINQRIKLIVESSQYKTINAFAKANQIPQTTLSDCINKNNEPRIGLLHKIIKAVPTINIVWLITGEGTPYSSEQESNFQKEDTPEEESKQGFIPYYENIVDLEKGAFQMFSTTKTEPTYYINCQHFKDCTAYFSVFGDSMPPLYNPKDIIAVKQIYYFDAIQWGEAYLIQAGEKANNLCAIRLLFQHEDDSSIILRSSNQDYERDTILSKKDIISLFLIKGKIVKNNF